MIRAGEERLLARAVAAWPEAVADYVIDAVRLVARDGWRLLRDYGSTRRGSAGSAAQAWSNPRCDSVM